MSTTGERLASLERLTAEIHLAVVGDGSAGSSLRERTAAIEEWRRGQDGMKHKGVRAAGNAIFTAAVAIVIQALHATYGGHA